MRQAATGKARACVALGLLPLCAFAARGDDWPHWRGPKRDGTTAETSRWEQRGWPPKTLWRTNVGAGGTSPVVVAGRVYAMGWSGGRDHVRCLDAATGQPHWTVSYACGEYGRFATGDEGLYSGVTSTPEYDAETGLLFTLSTDGHLHAWDTTREGQRRWGFNLYDRFGVRQRPKATRTALRDYGYTTSPLVFGKWVIVEVGAAAGTLAAFDKRTGDLRWSSQAKAPAGHSGGLAPIAVEGKPCVAVLHLQGLLVARLDAGHEGQTVGELPWATDYANSIASPAVADNCVLVTSGYNQSKMSKLRVTLAGIQKVWEQGHVSQICTPIVRDDRIYWSWETMFCADANDGKLLWRGDRLGDAGSCLLTADDRLLAWTGRGTLTLLESAKRSPRNYQRLFQKEILGDADAWPHLVLADGRLFCKDRAGELVCLSLEGQP